MSNETKSISDFYALGIWFLQAIVYEYFWWVAAGLGAWGMCWHLRLDGSAVKSVHFQHPFPRKLKKLWGGWGGPPRLYKLGKLQQRWREWLEAAEHICGRGSSRGVLAPRLLLCSLEAQLPLRFYPDTLSPAVSLLRHPLKLLSSPA